MKYVTLDEFMVLSAYSNIYYSFMPRRLRRAPQQGAPSREPSFWLALYPPNAWKRKRYVQPMTHKESERKDYAIGDNGVMMNAKGRV
jgi:hypothetical protein